MPPQGQEGVRPSCQERDPCGDISALMLRDVTLTNVGVICCQNVATPTSPTDSHGVAIACSTPLPFSMNCFCSSLALRQFILGDFSRPFRVLPRSLSLSLSSFRCTLRPKRISGHIQLESSRRMWVGGLLPDWLSKETRILHLYHGTAKESEGRGAVVVLPESR